VKFPIGGNAYMLAREREAEMVWFHCRQLKSGWKKMCF